MGVLKDVKEIKTDIKELKGNLGVRAKRADELENYISKIELKVKSVSEVPGADGKTDIRVVYEIPQIIIKFDDSGEIIENEVFRAINMLNLISFDDMLKISNVIKNKLN